MRILMEYLHPAAAVCSMHWHTVHGFIHTLAHAAGFACG